MHIRQIGLAVVAGVLLVAGSTVSAGAKPKTPECG
jgi:hypothetical protein